MSETTEKALKKITEKQSQYTENDKHYWRKLLTRLSVISSA